MGDFRISVASSSSEPDSEEWDELLGAGSGGSFFNPEEGIGTVSGFDPKSDASIRVGFGSAGSKSVELELPLGPMRLMLEEPANVDHPGHLISAGARPSV